MFCEGFARVMKQAKIIILFQKDKGYEKYISWCLKVIQSHRKKNWVSTVHHVGEINCQTLKKTDSFWNNIPPGKFDPYVGAINCQTLKKKKRQFLE